MQQLSNTQKAALMTGKAILVGMMEYMDKDAAVKEKRATKKAQKETPVIVPVTP